VDAVLANDDALVTALLNAGVSPQSIAPNGETPLCAALRASRPDLAILFLMYGADPNTSGIEGQAPIALASLRRHPQLLRVLLAAGADPNKPFATPHSKNLLALVGDEYLRSEMKQERNITPLMACAARGDVEAVTLLLQWGAKKDKHTLPHYRYAINFAADPRYLYVMRLLLGRDPEREPHVLVTVNLSRQRASLAVEGVTKLETAISTGRRGYATPPGRYVITNKYKHWVSTLYDVPMPYFMRLNCGAIGLHSGYVTGRPASHGCIRLPDDMARRFFNMVNVGDEVTIEY
jgi:ankyrin repeat protein